MAVHAETSTFNLTLFDAHVNLLRTQTEAMSAALGGVDSMTVTPFDKTYETPDEFSERLARNQQLLLKEESHFDKVIDRLPALIILKTLRYLSPSKHGTCSCRSKKPEVSMQH